MLHKCYRLYFYVYVEKCYIIYKIECKIADRENKIKRNNQFILYVTLSNKVNCSKVLVKLL